MFCGVAKGDLMVRVGPEAHEEALGEVGARPMDFTSRPMKGYVFVGPSGYNSDAALGKRVKRGADFVSTLRPKAKPISRTKRRA